MAHKQPELLTKLINSLDNPAAGFVIHLDKKADPSLFQKDLHKSNCHFIKNPIEVFWGGFSQVKATLMGMEEAVEHFDFNYFVYLSGQDFPIKSNNYISNFIEQQSGKEFIDYYYIPESSHTFNTRTRIDRYYWMDRKEDFFRKAFNKIGSFVKGRKAPYNFIAIGGCAYFGFTSSLVNYIRTFLRENKKYTRYFKYTVCADEAFFHTLVYNSKFKDARGVVRCVCGLCCPRFRIRHR